MLDIPATWLIQIIELTKIEKEKEALNIDLINCKDRLLKHEEKGKQWKKYAELWGEEKGSFEGRKVELERE